MRWVLIFLLLLNGIEYFWLSHRASSDSDQSSLARATPTQSQGAARLVLRSEVSEAKGNKPSNVASSLPGVEVVSETGGEAKHPVCGLMGPFPEIISARQFVTRLKSLAIDAGLKRQSLLADPVYLVYLEPQESRKAALALLKDLQAKRLDSFLITQGEQKFGVSLGFFRLRESAEKVRAKRIEDGFDARILKKERRREVLWAALQAEDYQKVRPELFAQLKIDYDYLQKRQNFCTHIASLDDIE